MVTTPRPSLVVHVDAFEYGCCRQPPAIGAAITGTLLAQPTTADRSPVDVTGWDRDRDLIAVVGGVARWDPTYGDPFDHLVGLLLSWHVDDVPGVAATGTVIRLSQTYFGPDSGSGVTLCNVDRVEKFPAPLRTPAGALEPGGAVVTLTDLEFGEPTDQQIADYRAAQEVARRTIRITAPPMYFGPTVPDRGERITVDLDDPTAQIQNRPPTKSGVVTGTTRQVSEAVIDRRIGPAGIIAYRRAPAGTATSKVTNDMFVVLVMDDPS